MNYKEIKDELRRLGYPGPYNLKKETLIHILNNWSKGMMCYMQEFNDCGHWGIRIASEYVSKQKFSPVEEKRFHEEWTCSLSGSNLRSNVEGFRQLFPNRANELTFISNPANQARTTRRTALHINIARSF